MATINVPYLDYFKEQRQRILDDLQIEREWQQVSNINFENHYVMPPQLPSTEDDTIEFDITELKSGEVEHISWSVSYKIAEKEYVSVAEFKQFISDLILEKGGALPNVKDWEEIKSMMDQMYDETLDNQIAESLEAQTNVQLNHALSSWENIPVPSFTISDVTPSDVHEAIGDHYYDTTTNTLLTWSGTEWLPITGGSDS